MLPNKHVDMIGHSIGFTAMCTSVLSNHAPFVLVTRKVYEINDVYCFNYHVLGVATVLL